MANQTVATANAKRLALRAKIAARKTAEPIQKDIAEAKAGTVSPDTVDKDIGVETVSLADAGAGKYARLKQIAAEEPEAASEGLEQVGDAFGQLADAVQNLRENLDLVPADEGLPLKERIAAYRRFAHSFIQLADEDPQALEQAITEVYQSLDEVAVALENYAGNMGLALPETQPSSDMPLDEAVVENPQTRKELEEPVVEKEAAGASADAFSNDRGHDGKPEVKEAADSGSEGFVTDRDEKGQPKEPQRLDVPRLAARAAYIVKVAQEAAARHKKADENYGKMCKGCGKTLAKGAKCPNCS
jgi:hypothetical protein